jgi:hypothetical protein
VNVLSRTERAVFASAILSDAAIVFLAAAAAFGVSVSFRFRISTPLEVFEISAVSF